MTKLTNKNWKTARRYAQFDINGPCSGLWKCCLSCFFSKQIVSCSRIPMPCYTQTCDITLPEAQASRWTYFLHRDIPANPGSICRDWSKYVTQWSTLVKPITCECFRGPLCERSWYEILCVRNVWWQAIIIWSQFHPLQRIAESCLRADCVCQMCRFIYDIRVLLAHSTFLHTYMYCYY